MSAKWEEELAALLDGITTIALEKFRRGLGFDSVVRELLDSFKTSTHWPKLPRYGKRLAVMVARRAIKRAFRFHQIAQPYNS